MYGGIITHSDYADYFFLPIRNFFLLFLLLRSLVPGLFTLDNTGFGDLPGNHLPINSSVELV